MQRHSVQFPTSSSPKSFTGARFILKALLFRWLRLFFDIVGIGFSRKVELAVPLIGPLDLLGVIPVIPKSRQFVFEILQRLKLVQAALAVLPLDLLLSEFQVPLGLELLQILAEL